MSYSRHQKFLFGATLQSRRWLMEQRLEAVEQNDMRQLTELFGSERPFRPAELTAALECAVLKKSDAYAACIELLLEKGANPGGVNGSGAPFLHIAADAGCLVIVELLLAAGCDPNQAKEDGSTALHRAVWNQHAEIARVLVKAGADVDQRDVQGRTPLILAAQRNTTTILQQLLQEAGSSPTSRDKKGRSALYWATRFDNVASVAALLSDGGGGGGEEVDVDSQDWQEQSALMVAAERGHSRVVELLLDHAADPDLRNFAGLTALMLATTNKHLDCVKLLVDFGADVNTKDGFGATPLLYLMNDPHTVYHLLEAGADPNISTCHDYNLTTAPLVAISDNSYSSLLVLLQLNADFLQRVHRQARLPLKDALKRGYFECVQVLYLASVCVGASLGWLYSKLASLPVTSTSDPLTEVERCHHWLRAQVDARGLVPSLFNLARGTVRQYVDPVFFEDNLEGLPIPKALQDSLKLSELDRLFQDES